MALRAAHRRAPHRPHRPALQPVQPHPPVRRSGASAMCRIVSRASPWMPSSRRRGAWRQRWTPLGRDDDAGRAGQPIRSPSRRRRAERAPVEANGGSSGCVTRASTARRCASDSPIAATRSGGSRSSISTSSAARRARFALGRARAARQPTFAGADWSIDGATPVVAHRVRAAVPPRRWRIAVEDASRVGRTRRARQGRFSPAPRCPLSRDCAAAAPAIDRRGVVAFVHTAFWRIDAGGRQRRAISVRS